jgi:hypothetical protein
MREQIGSVIGSCGYICSHMSLVHLVPKVDLVFVPVENQKGRSTASLFIFPSAQAPFSITKVEKLYTRQAILSVLQVTTTKSQGKIPYRFVVTSRGLPKKLGVDIKDVGLTE